MSPYVDIESSYLLCTLNDIRTMPSLPNKSKISNTNVYPGSSTTFVTTRHHLRAGTPSFQNVPRGRITETNGAY